MNQRDISMGETPTWSWVAYCIVRILRNLSVLSDDEGRSALAVRNAMTDELRRVLPNIDGNARKELGDAAAIRIRSWIRETWA